MEMNTGEIWGLTSSAVIFALGLIRLLTDGPSKTVAIESKPVKEVKKQKPAGPSWSQRLMKGLEKSRNDVWGKLSGLISGSSLNDDAIEEIEELLYSSDMGAETISTLIEELTAYSKKEQVDGEKLNGFLYNFFNEKLTPIQKNVSQDLYQFNTDNGLKVIMIVGVNGAGKTTTIGKLATKLTWQGAKVVVGACDTFRAAAVDQLEVWCERAGARNGSGE
jgi:fused signal recognition particle receptor